MKTSKSVLIAVALASLALLGVALYLQFVEKMLPCPLCIIQRYAFAAVALICLITAVLPQSSAKGGAGLGMLAAFTGAGVALWHLWVKAHPAVSCGIDPLETSLNKIPTAKLLPFLFQADGLCTTEYAPIFGLSIPQWSFAWFIAFAVVLGWVTLRRAR
ncbi:MAG TPA: disulfide bond formation protein B [Burkholderiaceae bacterium]|nr:disulfide bond formation protein B [Burkholderiaceae bacterium]